MSGKRVLVVDDDQAIVQMLELILEEEGYSVSWAYTGHESLICAKEHRPDLILLDLMLPDLHGTVVAQKIRNEPALQHIPILVVSASKDMQNIVQTMDVQGAVAKPFQINVLLSSIERHVAR